MEDLLRSQLRKMVESDPEFRIILRQAVKEHLEVLRNELVSLDKANQELAEAYQIGLEQIDKLTERVDLLERVILHQQPGLPPAKE